MINARNLCFNLILSMFLLVVSMYAESTEFVVVVNKNNTINSQSFFMLVCHGLLHLFGYSHYDRQSRSNMRFLENMFMKFIGLKPVHED